MTDSENRSVGLVKWYPLVLIGLGLLSYLNSFGKPFIFDDDRIIKDNPAVRGLTPVPLMTRSVCLWSFRLNHAVSGLNVADYHAVNVAIHILAGLLLFGVMRRTLILPSMRERYGLASPHLALVTAGIWLVHPLQTESVTYICQRFESMMGMFFMLTLYCFIRGVGSERKRLWFNGALLSCLAGMGTKEVMATAPILVLLYDYIFVGQGWGNVFRQRWRVHASLFALIGVFVCLLVGATALTIQAGEHTAPVAASGFSYLATQFGVIVHYLRLSIWPYPLCLDYGWPLSRTPGDVMLPGVFVVALALVSVWAIVKRKAAGFPGAWFLVILAPTSSIIALEDVAVEHRMYLPLAAVICVLTISVYGVLKAILGGRSQGSKVVAATGFGLALLLFCVLAAAAIARNADYGSNEKMWRSVVRVRPDNLRAHISLATTLMKEGRDQEALPYLSVVTNRIPEVSGTTSRKDLNDYGMAHDALGVLCYREGRFAVAETHFRDSVKAIPEYVNARNNLGLALKAQGRTRDAADAWTESIRIRPRNPVAHYNLGYISEEQGDWAKAVRQLKEATVQSPEMIEAKLELAWLLATCEDESLVDAGEALSLIDGVKLLIPFDTVRILDVLGAANARLGRFDDAVRFAGSALSLGRKNGWSGLEGIEEREKLYRERRIYVLRKEQPRD